MIVAGILDKLGFNVTDDSGMTTVHFSFARFAEAQRMREFKKYPNRRLYDIRNSRYVTLEDVRNIILNGETISVVDSKTDRNLTRTVLLQIMAVQECNGNESVLTNTVLEHLIRCSDGGLKGLMSHCIETSVKTFLHERQQEGGVARNQ